MDPDTTNTPTEPSNSGGSIFSQQQQAQPTATPPAQDWRSAPIDVQGIDGPLASAKTWGDADKIVRDSITAARAKTDGMVKVPTEKSSPDELAAWRRAVGVPDTPDAYGELRPEAIPAEQWDGEIEKAVKSWAHENHVPPKALKALLAIEEQRGRAAMATVEAQQRAQMAGQIATLKQEWGAEFDANIRQAQRVALTIGLQPTSPLFRDADAVRAMLRVAGLINGDRLVNGATQGLAASPREQATAIMTDKNNPHYAAYQRGDANAVALVNNLLQQR